jgi:hypothetical protein
MDPITFMSWPTSTPFVIFSFDCVALLVVISFLLTS